MSLSNCTTTKAIDSYCYLYDPLITKKGDTAKFASVPIDKRQILLGNEQIYQGTCKNGNAK